MSDRVPGWACCGSGRVVRKRRDAPDRRQVLRRKKWTRVPVAMAIGGV